MTLGKKDNVPDLIAFPQNISSLGKKRTFHTFLQVTSSFLLVNPFNFLKFHLFVVYLLLHIYVAYPDSYFCAGSKHLVVSCTGPYSSASIISLVSMLLVQPGGLLHQ